MKETLIINYNNCSSLLCDIRKKYDTDKSSQRENINSSRYCHPYTLFYENLFKNNKEDKLSIAELGILRGASILMWKEYFINANIYGFEHDQSLIDTFTNNNNMNRIELNRIDVTNKESIIRIFNEIGVMYDIIIEDTTHNFEDQIRVIENVYQYLNPGGILIIKDIFRHYNENDYIERLQPILDNFQDYYFVDLDHKNKNSDGWNNNKLFILVKNGAKPIFKNNNKITIITPSYRIDNLLKIKNSINFDYVDEWIIVYDGNKIQSNPCLFKDFSNKIKEYINKDNGNTGNPQRNYGISKVINQNTTLYFLDDDNIIHPNLYNLLDLLDNTKFYTFNQENRLIGNNINVGSIDTAMALIPYKICNDIRWIIDRYDADGYYIKDCYNISLLNHIFVNNNLCYYNKLN